MDNLKSRFEALSDDELIEVLTIKKSQFTEEAIKAAKEELNKRNLTLTDDVISEINSEEEVKEWYYALNGERIGAISKSELLNLYKTEKIFLSTKVWKSGMSDWVELGQTDLIEKDNLPPPLKGKDINNTLVWILAFVPIIGTALEYLISGAIGITSGSLWFVTVILNFVLCIIDERKLKKAGYNTKEMMLWAIFLVPVYLFRRAYLLKQKNTYAIAWCIAFAILIFAPSWISGITGITDPSVVTSVKGGVLYSYPNKTIEQMVNNYFSNPKWEAIVADDRKTYVNITGRISYDGEDVNVLMQYITNSDNSFELQALEFDGVPQNIIVYNALIEAMYYK